MAESTTRSTTTLTGTIPGSVNVTGEEMAGLSLSEGRDTDTTTLAIPESQPDVFNKKVKKLVKSIKRTWKQKQEGEVQLERPLVQECQYDDDAERPKLIPDISDSDSDDTNSSVTPTYPDVWVKFDQSNTSIASDTYDFNHFRRGVAVLIVNTEFSNPGNNRPYAVNDITNITALFAVLDFKVVLLKNKTSSELMGCLTDIRSHLETDSDCFACLISTHGEEVPIKGHANLRQHVLSTYDGKIETDVVIQHFNDSNCKAMRGKPKLFFIQACRSKFGAADVDIVDPGVIVNVITDSPVSHHTGAGGGHQGSRHQGGSHRSASSASTTDAQATEQGVGETKDITTSDGHKPEPEAGLTGPQDVTIEGDNTTKSDARGQPDDKTANAYGFNDIDIPYADEEERLQKEQQTANREAFRKYQQRVHEKQERQDTEIAERQERERQWQEWQGRQILERLEQDRWEREMAEQMKSEMNDPDFCVIPCYTHCLIMFSSATERLAWCDNLTGGWLPYCMYQVVQLLHRNDFRTDLLEVLTEVNHVMSVYLETNISEKPEWHQSKSAACIYHMLTKDIYFRLKWRHELVTEV